MEDPLPSTSRGSTVISLSDLRQRPLSSCSSQDSKSVEEFTDIQEPTPEISTPTMGAQRFSTSEEDTAVVLRDLGHITSMPSPFDSRALSTLQTHQGPNSVNVIAHPHASVHVGEENNISYNILLNVGVGERERVCSTVKQVVEEIKWESRFAQAQEPPRNDNFLFTGVRDFAGRWYYWLTALVALSCVGSIAAAVVFAIDNLWMPSEQDVNDILAALRRAFWFLVVPLVTLSCMNLVSTMLLSLSRAVPVVHSPPQPQRSTTNEDRDLVEQLPGGVQLMRRSFWRARPPCEVLDDNLLPITTVVVCHTATRSPADSDEIARIILGFQRYHIDERFLDDISYNFLIGLDGRVYEGRGWTKVSGHARGRGRGLLAVAIIGNFVHQLPPDNQLDTLFRFLDGGVQLGMLTEDYTLLAHCQVVNTASPGRALLDNMTTWPRFDRSKPINCSSN